MPEKDAPKALTRQEMETILINDYWKAHGRPPSLEAIRAIVDLILHRRKDA